MELTKSQETKFVEGLSYGEVDGTRHIYYRALNTNVEGVSRRPHVVLWYLTTGRWPGRLEKTCEVERCILHYKEKRKVVIPLTDNSWGAGRAYAEKFGVSESYVSRLRRNND